MRKPSVHILEDDLRLILFEWFKDNEIGKPVRSLVDHIMTKGKFVQILSRSILQGNKKDQVRTDRITSSMTGDAQLFATLLKMRRQAMKHRNVAVIREGSKDWQFIKEATALADGFYESFEGNFKDRRSAYIEYIDNFIAVMAGPFSIRKANSIHDKVVSRYEAKDQINQFKNTDLLNEMHSYYQTKVFEKTGHNFDYTNQPDQFIHFIAACNHAEELGLSIKQFIDSQFEALDFASAIPYPVQLGNAKALERSIRWMAQNQIKNNISRSPKDKAIVKKLKAMLASEDNFE